MVTVILMVVVGGLGHVWGGVIGAALITLVAEWTRSYYQYEFIIFGLIVVLTMMYMPRGIGGYIDRRLATRQFIALRRDKATAEAIWAHCWRSLACPSGSAALLLCRMS
jgi:hypothetical protein